MKRHRLRWLGHVAQIDESTQALEVFDAVHTGGRGRPLIRWITNDPGFTLAFPAGARLRKEERNGAKLSDVNANKEEYFYYILYILIYFSC